jgi:hypothetical protein
MDIIIRNGVIQSDESKRVHEIKNNAGLLKKDYRDYVKGIPGPYYDFFDCHLCVPRKYDQIQNFSGPQHKKKIKLMDTKDFNKLIRYCSICHCEIRPNPCFSAKRKVFIEEDTFARKVEVNFDLQEQFKKIKICHQNSSENSSDIDLITTGLKKTSVDVNAKWNKLYGKISKNLKKDNLNFVFRNYKSTQQKVINKYYQMVYKLVKTPILYPISMTETKLIWPWNLTKYQKFKLENPDYKSSVIFSHRINYKITENYVMIE